MASELRVNTLKDAAGNNSIAMRMLRVVVRRRGCSLTDGSNTVNEQFCNIFFNR